MADYAVEISLPDHKLGDRWDIVTAIGPVLVNAAQPDNILTRVRMQFRKGKLTFRLDSDATRGPDALIVIDDEDTWEASIPTVENFLPEDGDWTWDMEFYEATHTSPRTFYYGTITVLPQISQ
jgi:hypothetical protein